MLSIQTLRCNVKEVMQRTSSHVSYAQNRLQDFSRRFECTQRFQNWLSLQKSQIQYSVVVTVVEIVNGSHCSYGTCVQRPQAENF